MAYAAVCGRGENILLRICDVAWVLIIS